MLHISLIWNSKKGWTLRKATCAAHSFCRIPFVRCSSERMSFGGFVGQTVMTTAYGSTLPAEAIRQLQGNRLILLIELTQAFEDHSQVSSTVIHL